MRSGGAAFRFAQEAMSLQKLGIETQSTSSHREVSDEVAKGGNNLPLAVGVDFAILFELMA